MPKEIEIKFLVADLNAIRRRLRASGFREKTGRTHEMNTLYDFPDSRLRQRGELLRIRQYGDTWTLTHKAKAVVGKHKSRIETETTLGDGNALDTIFRSLGLTPSFRYEKFRAEWSDDNGHVVLDETPIGDIAEIEGSPRWIDRTGKDLGITPKQYITSSYAELFFQWKQRTGSPANEMTFRECQRRRSVRVPRSKAK